MKSCKAIGIIVVLALVAVIAGLVYKCNAKPDQEEAVAIVSKLNTEWDEAFAQASAGTISSYYDANGSLLPAGGEQVTGNNDIADFWSGLFSKGFTEHQITLVEAGVVGNTLYQRAKWSAVLKGADGAEPQHFGGNLHLLYKKQDDGSWKILTHTWN